MAKEIEKKFLVTDDSWQHLASGMLYRQGYIFSDDNRSVRVRIADNKGILTIKGAAKGISRNEWEYSIPLQDAQEMLEEVCEKPIIVKRRYRIQTAECTWEVDQFEAENQGLVIAEVELQHEDQPLDLPSWIGREVTGIPRYYNASLRTYPYSQWRRDEQENPT